MQRFFVHPRCLQIVLGVLMLCLLGTAVRQAGAEAFTFTKVADSSTPVPGGSGNFAGFNFEPSLDRGNVAFQGSGSSFGQQGIYTDIGGLGVVADTSTAIPGGSGNFVSTNRPSLDGGDVAFKGFGSIGTSGDHGIYTDIGGSLMKVVDLSDMLDGKTLSFLSSGGEALSGNQIAFFAQFTDGSKGIYVATAVPEPSAETLGFPSIPIALGSGIVAAGVGLETQPGKIKVKVPGDVIQVLLYWSGEFQLSSDDTINIDGNPVTGSSIGGPTTFFSNVQIETFRADITDLGLVARGNNNLTVEGLSFDVVNHGAGVLVIYDDGAGTADIGVRDGQDLAFVDFAPPLDTTVSQTFNFASLDVDRMADLAIFAGSIAEDRPNAIDITVNGSPTTLVNPLGNSDGDFWDTFTTQVPVPANASSLTVQVLSQGDGSGNLPASFNWIAASLSVPLPQVSEGEGCPPDFWSDHLNDWVQVNPADDFDTTFGVDLFNPDITLEEAVNLRGGRVKKLARHGTAGLVNALHPDVNYPLSAAEVIALVQAGEADILITFNELGCEIP